MFDVLVYLYENYWRPDACPEPKQLSRTLSAVGFEPDEIQDALRWLDARDLHTVDWLPADRQVLGDLQRAMLGWELQRRLGPSG